MANERKRAHLSYVTQSNDLSSSEGDEAATEHRSKLKDEGPSSPTNPAKRQKKIRPASHLYFGSEQHPSSPSSHGSPRALNEHGDVHSLAAALPSSEFSCELHVYFDLHPQGLPIKVMLDSTKTRWASESFQLVEEKAFEQLARSKMTQTTHTLYRKSGICKLIRHGEKQQRHRDHAAPYKVPFHHMVSCQPASDPKEWTELWFAISAFRGQYNRDNFHLRVEWNFSGFETLPFGAPGFESAVRTALASKMKTNWKRAVYLSRTDLDNVFSEDVILHLIERDPSLKGLEAENSEAKGTFDKEYFANQVYTWNSRMLAICVYVDLPLICLWRLWHCGKRDQDLPLPDTIEKMCGEHKKEFRDFMQWQGAFIAHLFQPLPMLLDEEDSSGVEINDGVTLPICFDKLKDKRRQGSYGHVYEAFVEPDHHHYVPGKHVKLALKIFHDYGSQTRADFDRECHMLKEISKMKPHDHVVTHISSFKHDTKFYMLFPLAECNLGDYLNEQTPPPTNRDFVLWLIKQMKGLASAVCYLHRAGKDIVQDAFENKLPLVPSRERTYSHHDLKPENILVFEDEKTGEKVLKISDFGSGRIGKPRTGMKGSYATKDPNTGTPDYEAPDWLLSEKSSRRLVARVSILGDVALGFPPSLSP